MEGSVPMSLDENGQVNLDPNQIKELQNREKNKEKQKRDYMKNIEKELAKRGDL